MNEPCHGCGETKTPVERTRTATVWHCPTCGISREEHDVRADLQREFDRREHP